MIIRNFRIQNTGIPHGRSFLPTLEEQRRNLTGKSNSNKRKKVENRNRNADIIAFDQFFRNRAVNRKKSGRECKAYQCGNKQNARQIKLQNCPAEGGSNKEGNGRCKYHHTPTVLEQHHNKIQKQCFGRNNRGKSGNDQRCGPRLQLHDIRQTLHTEQRQHGIISAEDNGTCAEKIPHFFVP